MKIVKQIFLILLILLIALPFITYIGIFITNNCIANEIEKDLVAQPLPSNTTLVDSVSVAARLTGSGNGMQYMGAILVESDLSEVELKEYYDVNFDFVEVQKQVSPKLDFIRTIYFNAVLEPENTYYSIICWDSNRRELLGDFITGLLDFDIRGH